jgi:hypothetical protein
MTRWARGPMPTRCTEAVTYRRIRDSCLPSLGTRAGKPDTLDRTSGPPPALLRSSRLQKSPRPEYASFEVGRIPAYARPDRSADISARSNPSRLTNSENPSRCASLGTRARFSRMPIAPPQSWPPCGRCIRPAPISDRSRNAIATAAQCWDCRCCG